MAHAGGPSAGEVQPGHAGLAELVEEPPAGQCADDAEHDIQRYPFTGLVHELACELLWGDPR